MRVPSAVAGIMRLPATMAAVDPGAPRGVDTTAEAGSSDVHQPPILGVVNFDRAPRLEEQQDPWSRILQEFDSALEVMSMSHPDRATMVRLRAVAANASHSRALRSLSL